VVKSHCSFFKSSCKNQHLNVFEADDLGKVDAFPASSSLVIKMLVNVFSWVVFEVGLYRFEFHFVGLATSLNFDEEASLHGIEVEGGRINNCKY